MAEEKITTNDFIDPSVLKELQAINKEMKDIVKTITQFMAVSKANNEELKKSSTTQEEVGKRVKTTQENTQKLSDVEKEIQKIEQQHYQVLTKMVAQRSEESRKLQQAVEQSKKENLERKASINNIEGLRAKNQLLRIEKEKLILTDKNYKSNLERINAEMDKNQKIIDSTNNSEQNRLKGIGKYKEGIVNAYVKIAAVIMVAKTAYDTVNNAIQENETTSEFLERKLGGLGAAYDVLKGKLFGFVEELISSNDKTTKWGDLFTSIVSAISMGFSDLVPGVRNLGKEMNDAAAKNEELIRKQQDLADLEGERLLKQSESNRKLAEARDLYNQQGISLEEKKNYLQDAIDLEQKQVNEEINYQTQIVANLIAQAELKKKSKTYDVGREGLRIQQEEAKLNDMITESLSRQRRAKQSLKNINEEIFNQITKELEEDKQWIKMKSDRVKLYNKMRVSDEKNVADSILQTNRTNFEEIDSLYAQNNAAIKGMYANRLVTEDQYNELLYLSEVDRLNDKISYAKNANLDASEYEMQLSDLTTTHKIENNEKEKASVQALNEYKQQIANQSFEFVGELYNKQIYDLERQKDYELSLAGDNAKAKESIETRYAAKIAAIKRKQAIAEKAQSLFNIGINTAQAIIKFLADPGGYPGLALSIAAGILGAAQAATVAAQPIPKFAKGVTDFEGGRAIVGEEGREAIRLKSGQVFLSPETATQMMLPSGTDVYTHAETEAMLNGGMQVEKFDQLINEQKITRKVIAGKPVHNVNITSGGWRETTRIANTTINHIDKYFRK